MCESEVKTAAPKITNRTAARTSFQDSQIYVTFFFWNGVLTNEKLL